MKYLTVTVDRLIGVKSPSARREWVEIFSALRGRVWGDESPSARREWVEIWCCRRHRDWWRYVSLREEGVG